MVRYGKRAYQFKKKIHQATFHQPSPLAEVLHPENQCNSREGIPAARSGRLHGCLLLTGLGLRVEGAVIVRRVTPLGRRPGSLAPRRSLASSLKVRLGTCSSASVPATSATCRGEVR